MPLRAAIRPKTGLGSSQKKGTGVEPEEGLIDLEQKKKGEGQAERPAKYALHHDESSTGTVAVPVAITMAPLAD